VVADRRVRYPSQGRVSLELEANLDGMVRGGSGEGGSYSYITSNWITLSRKFPTNYTERNGGFLTSANANVILAEAASGERPARWALTTGMASIPWEYLFFYMSPAEYNRMKNYPGTFAKSLQYVLGQWNTRVAFKLEILKQLMLH
jgi:hypothetical protein